MIGSSRIVNVVSSLLLLSTVVLITKLNLVSDHDRITLEKKVEKSEIKRVS